MATAQEIRERSRVKIMGGNFMVEVVEQRKKIWAHGAKRGQMCGMSNRTYRETGKAAEIVEALRFALYQAECAAGLHDNERIPISN